MKSILDPDFEYTPSVATDIRATFERVWRELDTRDQSHSSPGDDRNSVGPECSGELLDLSSVKVLRDRKLPRGFEMLEFVCPRCRQRHESLQIR